MGLFQHCGRSACCILTPNKFPHSSPEAPRIIQMRETSTSCTFYLFLFPDLFCCTAEVRSAREAGTLQFVPFFFYEMLFIDTCSNVTLNKQFYLYKKNHMHD